MPSASWMYEQHSETALREWATSLRFFRFCRAFGGHANDGDVFKVALACGSEPELREICTALGLALNPLPPDEPKPIPGRGYPAEEFEKFRTPMTEFPAWQQPGYCELQSVHAFVWVERGVFRVDLMGASGDVFAVDDADFRNAQRLERHLVPLASRVIDPPQDNDYCICPKYYPSFWTTGPSSSA